MKLSDREWKPCKLSELGRVESGKDIYAMERIEGDIPYVTSGSQNNGIGYFVANKNKTLDKGYIAFNRNGAVGLAFYHPYWSVMGNDCRKLHISKADENIYVGLFISTVISMQSKSFSYSRKLGTARANKLQVMLPVDDNDKPDYQFMEDYMKELMVAKRKQYQEYVEQRLAELDIDAKMSKWGGYNLDLESREWHVFLIGDLFSVKRPPARNKDDYEVGEVPFVASGSVNNGVMKCCKSHDDEKLDDAGCITVSPVDGSAFYQPYSFLGRGGAGSSILMLYADNLNLYSGQFIAKMISNTCMCKYTYGHMGNKDGIKRERIMLPINDNDEPDYDFMEEYERKMMAKKYMQCLKFLESSGMI